MVFFVVDIDGIRTREQRSPEQPTVGPYPRRNSSLVRHRFLGKVDRCEPADAGRRTRRRFPLPRTGQSERLRPTDVAIPDDRFTVRVERCQPGTVPPDARSPIVTEHLDGRCPQPVRERGVGRGRDRPPPSHGAATSLVVSAYASILVSPSPQPPSTKI